MRMESNANQTPADHLTASLVTAKTRQILLSAFVMKATLVIAATSVMKDMY
ncbi:MAG: hypothetical protein BWX66_01610 [Deltaproteobacteria bacterium ADurb.Bin058]|nr:MAG: hypothetical protein BWX66_01610 [Deltaproteobacteria bacterium ADurb.Bin058]